jgi:hypothetical protein
MLRDSFSGILFRREMGDASFVPFAAGGGNRKKPFTASTGKWEAAIRYATLIFWPDRRLRSGSYPSVQMTDGYGP